MLGVVAAAAVGAACTLYLNPRQVTPFLAAASPTNQPTFVTPQSSTTLLRRVKGLEQRVGALEEEPVEGASLKAGQADETHARAIEFDTSPTAPPAGYYHERHENSIAAHLSEPIDASWGPRFTQTLRADAERLASVGHYTLNDVECRDSTCRLSVHWENFGTARASYEQLLHQPLALNCERTILVPETDADVAVDATLLLDCSEWKANGSEVLDFQSRQPPVVPPAELP